MLAIRHHLGGVMHWWLSIVPSVVWLVKNDCLASKAKIGSSYNAMSRLVGVPTVVMVGTYAAPAVRVPSSCQEGPQPPHRAAVSAPTARQHAWIDRGPAEA